MGKSVLNLTVKIRNQEKVMTNTEVKDIDGSFVVKFRGLNFENLFLYTITSEFR